MEDVYYRKKRGKNFFYIDENNKIIKSPDILERIKKMRIAPAYHDVIISKDPNNYIQAIGVDDKNRKQYVYHSSFIEKKTKEKYERMKFFGGKIQNIRKDIEKYLLSKSLDEDKAVSLALRMMDKYHFRVGNEKYKHENKSYGLTTLQPKHFTLVGDKAYVKFNGKKGVINEAKIDDKHLIWYIKKLKEYQSGGGRVTDGLFQYIDDGQTNIVTPELINDWLKYYGDISSKDFRTWGANSSLIEKLLKVKEIPDNKTKIKKTLIQAIKDNSVELNHTAAISKKNYIHPGFLDYYTNNTEEFYNMSKNYSKRKYLDKSDQILINILDKLK